MEKDRENMAEELSPFLPPSSIATSNAPIDQAIRSKDDIQNYEMRSVFTHGLIVLLGISLCSNVLLYLYMNSAPFLDAACILHTQQNPTPIDVPIKFRTVHYDGTFLANTTSIYRLPPSPSVDAAWEDLGTTSGPLLLTPSQASHVGINPDYLKTTSGDFPVLFEFNHHLHCLNMLRKAVFFNYPYYSVSDAPERHLGVDDLTITKHVTHCLNMLRQVIQCKPDLGVFGQHWVRDESQGINEPFVDFNTDHKCIDWEALREWVREHQSKEKLEVELRDGDKILDIAP